MHRSLSTTHWLLACSLVSSSGCLLLADPPSTIDYGSDFGFDSDSDSSAPTTGWFDLAVGYDVCALDADGAMWCGQDVGSLGPVDVGPFVSVSRSDWGETCGVTASGTLRCDIGGSDGFELSEIYTAVSGSSDAGCGLKTSGAARCWPEANNVSGPFQSVGAGDRFACGILESSGSLQCWSIDSITFEEALAAPAGSFSRVATRGHVGCALSTSGSIECWGDDFSGLLPGPPAGSYVDLSLNDDGCAVTTSGSIVCWGDNAGDPNYSHLFPPAGITFARVSVGYDLSCGIATDTSLHCW